MNPLPRYYFYLLSTYQHIIIIIYVQEKWYNWVYVERTMNKEEIDEKGNSGHDILCSRDCSGHNPEPECRRRCCSSTLRRNQHHPWQVAQSPKKPQEGFLPKIQIPEAFSLFTS